MAKRKQKKAKELDPSVFDGILTLDQLANRGTYESPDDDDEPDFNLGAPLPEDIKKLVKPDEKLLDAYVGRVTSVNDNIAHLLLMDRDKNIYREEMLTDNLAEGDYFLIVEVKSKKANPDYNETTQRIKIDNSGFAYLREIVKGIPFFGKYEFKMVSGGIRMIPQK